MVNKGLAVCALLVAASAYASFSQDDGVFGGGDGGSSGSCDSPPPSCVTKNTISCGNTEGFCPNATADELCAKIESCSEADQSRYCAAAPTCRNVTAEDVVCEYLCGKLKKGLTRFYTQEGGAPGNYCDPASAPNAYELCAQKIMLADELVALNKTLGKICPQSACLACRPDVVQAVVAQTSQDCCYRKVACKKGALCDCTTL